MSLSLVESISPSSLYLLSCKSSLNCIYYSLLTSAVVCCILHDIKEKLSSTMLGPWNSDQQLQLSGCDLFFPCISCLKKEILVGKKSKSSHISSTNVESTDLVTFSICLNSLF